jgi:hypothetical protein
VGLWQRYSFGSAAWCWGGECARVRPRKQPLGVAPGGGRRAPRWGSLTTVARRRPSLLVAAPGGVTREGRGRHPGVCVYLYSRGARCQERLFGASVIVMGFWLFGKVINLSSDFQIIYFFSWLIDIGHGGNLQGWNYLTHTLPIYQRYHYPVVCGLIWTIVLYSVRVNVNLSLSRWDGRLRQRLLDAVPTVAQVKGKLSSHLSPSVLAAWLKTQSDHLSRTAMLTLAWRVIHLVGIALIAAYI